MTSELSALCWFENDRVITTPTVTLKTTAPTAEGSWEARPGPAVQDWDFWAVMPTLTQKAEQWISEQKADQPFFLYFPFTSPHAPIVPTPDFAGKSQAGGYGDFMFRQTTRSAACWRLLRSRVFGQYTRDLLSR